MARLTIPYGVAGDNIRFASIHSNPPGVLTDIPSVAKVKYGKGTVIWSALPIENEDSYHHRKIMIDLLREYVPVKDQSITTDASADVEIVAFADGDDIKISLIDLGAGAEGRVLSPCRISVAADTAPK